MAPRNYQRGKAGKSKASRVSGKGRNRIAKANSGRRGPISTIPATKKIIHIGLDFGTGYSSACYLVLDEGEDITKINPTRIKPIQNYPENQQADLQGGRVNEVPTEILFVYLREGNRVVPKVFWGYEVQNELKKVKNSTSLWSQAEVEKGIIRNFKLLLDNTEHTKDFRDNIERQLREVFKDTSQQPQAIEHFLTAWIEHCLAELEKTQAQTGYTKGDKVYFDIAVPPVWEHRALQKMHDAFARALYNIDSPNVQQREDGFSSQVHGLFFASEPEAHAFSILEDENNVGFVRDRDRMLLLDVGSGTVDAIVFVVQNAQGKMKLQQETITGEGRLCGSAYVNNHFRELCRQRLQHAKFYGNAVQASLVHLVIEAELMSQFESYTKRTVKFTMDDDRPPDTTLESLVAASLRENKKHNFGPSKMFFTLNEFQDIHRHTCEGTWELAETMLRKTANKNGKPTVTTKKLVLAGGAGRSTVIKAFIEGELAKKVASHNWPSIPVLVPSISDSPGVAASRGAILAFLNWEKAPARKMQCSYGLKISEEFDGSKQTHVDARDTEKVEECELTGKEYVENLICWIYKKGQEITTETREYTMHMERIIHCDIDPEEYKKQWCWNEEIFVSYTTQEDSYPVDHAENENSECIATMNLDLSLLEETLVPIEGNAGRRYYAVEFWVVFEVNGWNLSYKAIDSDGNPLAGVPEGWFSIAASFKPGEE
ncbi:hypothetical protein BT63DRAFT_465743 [Microthyrium microscopicum]|uniref:Actin-like ATPase domain-containing protein n=1 Tax=Microthyrium microscopicum TaxID=703497 RepID=A0A6A6TX57_9PEZI|nr:hypothetical protein BT63DRAFT_465743 [Microthyrium microscopicum]